MSDKRQTERAKLFLAATLHAGNGMRKVTVRNMSIGGALVEMHEPPPVGTAVELGRGHLRASGTVVWVRGSECGLHFDMALPLQDWLPRASYDGQKRVDATIAKVRAGAPLPEHRTDPAPAAQDATRSVLIVRLTEELGYVARLLESLGDELADDRTVTARHGARLQDLDIAIQILGHVGAVLNCGRPTGCDQADWDGGSPPEAITQIALTIHAPPVWRQHHQAAA